MFQKIDLTALSDHQAHHLTSDFIGYMKPALGRLMRTLKLDVEYIDGLGNELIYRDASGELHAVLDATGGYGANLFGHRNPSLDAAAAEAIAQFPANTQGSLRAPTVRLAARPVVLVGEPGRWRPDEGLLERSSLLPFSLPRRCPSCDCRLSRPVLPRASAA